MDFLEYVLAYERSFHDSYEVPCEEEQIVDIINYMESTNFILAPSRRTYSRYIFELHRCAYAVEISATVVDSDQQGAAIWKLYNHQVGTHPLFRLTVATTLHDGTAVLCGGFLNVY